MIDAENLTQSAQRMARLMALGIAILSLCVVVLLAALVTRFDDLGLTLAGWTTFPLETVRAWQTLALTGVVSIHLGIWITVFALARKMFVHLTRTDMGAAARQAVYLSNCLWVMLAWLIFSRTLIALVATWHFAEGSRSLVVTFGTSEVLLALCALIAGFMARAFALGAELWRDHQAVI